MSYTTTYGRLGNNIIRNTAVSIIAEKHNLKVDYIYNELMNQLGIQLFSGKNQYEEYSSLTETNYFDIYNSKQINFNIYPIQPMQTKEITDAIFNYLRNDKIKNYIILNNEYKERYNNNNDLFIHIRLTDVAKYNPGIEYYIKTIDMIDYDNIYISTDEEEHYIIQKLKQLYPNVKIIKFKPKNKINSVIIDKTEISDEIETIQFASTCKHIILSHGSFSAIIGYLSFFSNVYYPKYETLWYGDMFTGSIKNWIEIDKKL